VSGTLRSKATAPRSTACSCGAALLPPLRSTAVIADTIGLSVGLPMAACSLGGGRRTFPTKHEATWYHSALDQPDVRTIAGASVGVLTCTELWKLEWASRLGQLGAQIVATPRVTGAESLDKWRAAGRVGGDLRQGRTERRRIRSGVVSAVAGGSSRRMAICLQTPTETARSRQLSSTWGSLTTQRRRTRATQSGDLNERPAGSGSGAEPGRPFVILRQPRSDGFPVSSRSWPSTESTAAPTVGANRSGPKR
jgi:hypothetical protein